MKNAIRPMPPAPSSAEQTITDTLALARACLDAGRHADAQALFEAVLQFDAAHAGALHGLGMSHLYGGMPGTALPLLIRACEADPARGETWRAMAECLLALNRGEEALHVLETALAAGLDDPRATALLDEARNGRHERAAPDATLVTTLTELARLSVRKAAVRRKSFPVASPRLAPLLAVLNWQALAAAALECVTRNPVHGKDWDLLGIAHVQLGHTSAGRVALKRATELLPDDAEVWDHLGIAERTARNYDASRKCFERSLKLAPKRPLTWVNLGNLQKDLNDLRGAQDSLQRALSLDPECLEAIGNLGHVMRELGDLPESAALCRRFLTKRPGMAEAHCNLGNVLVDLNEDDEAAQCYARALEIQPDLAQAMGGLGRLYLKLGHIDESLAFFDSALSLRGDFTEIHSMRLMALSYFGHQSPEYYLAAARSFGRRAAAQATARHTAWAPPCAAGALRIGFVSGDLRQHPVGYFLEAILPHLVSEGLQLHAYHTIDQGDALSARIRPHFAGWTSIRSLDDATAARRIHADGLDILIDLSGHTALNRLPLFAWRPAPVQLSWLGYFASTGMADIDYFLADPWVVPPGEEAHFAERVWRLPESYLCFTPPAEAGDVAPLPALLDGRLTFGSFNNLIKLTDEVVTVWGRLLQALPGSRLFLKTLLLDKAEQQRTTRERFARVGISPDRLILEGQSPRAQLLASYNRVDIALDPFPYPGGTTSAEALWMGVPVLTRQGDRFLSRVGETVAHNAGMGDWIARDDDDYLRLATHFGQDLPALATLRAGLRERLRAAPLFDAARFARHFTAALRDMAKMRHNPEEHAA